MKQLFVISSVFLWFQVYITWGWKIETTIDASGLITPSQFQSADGELNDRDLNQCLTETGINDAIEDGA